MPETPDFTPVELPEIALTPTLTVNATIDFAQGAKRKIMGDYTGTFGTPGEQTDVKGLQDAVQDISYFVDESSGRRRYIVVSETTRIYDALGVLAAKTEVFHYYAKGYVPVRVVEKHWVLTNLPGQTEKLMTLISVKTTLQRHCKKPMNLSMTSELFEGLVMYEEIEKNGVVYKTDPMVLAEVLRADTTQSVIDTKPGTYQRLLEMTISERTTTISRADDELLLKREHTYDHLTGHARFNSQILENPMRDRNKVKSDHKFRKEYHDGPGKLVGGYGPCYHPAKTIHHDDICTETLADQIADRVFKRKNIDKNHEWSIKIPFPVPIESLAMVIALPDFKAYVNGVLTTIPGGDYVLKSVAESFSYNEVRSNVVDPQPETTLVVRKRY